MAGGGRRGAPDPARPAGAPDIANGPRQSAEWGLLSQADVDAVAATPHGWRAFALLQIGQPDRAEAELRALWSKASARPGVWTVADDGSRIRGVHRLCHPNGRSAAVSGWKPARRIGLPDATAAASRRFQYRSSFGVCRDPPGIQFRYRSSFSRRRPRVDADHASHGTIYYRRSALRAGTVA